MSDRLTVLLPTDDSPSARAAASHIVGLAARGLAAEVHLLAVQAPLRGGAAGWIGGEARNAWHRDEGMKTLAGCEAILAAAGIPIHCHVAVGDPATLVAEFAARLGCAQVVMGTRGLSPTVGLVLGSVAAGVIAHCRLPVTLVQAGVQAS
jgi:nucleotide-binding universal stress UspA family protein